MKQLIHFLTHLIWSSQPVLYLQVSYGKTLSLRITFLEYFPQHLSRHHKIPLQVRGFISCGSHKPSIQQYAKLHTSAKTCPVKSLFMSRSNSSLTVLCHHGKPTGWERIHFKQKTGASTINRPTYSQASQLSTDPLIHKQHIMHLHTVKKEIFLASNACAALSCSTIKTTVAHIYADSVRQLIVQDCSCEGMGKWKVFPWRLFQFFPMENQGNLREY